MDVFFEISIILMLATAMAALMQALRQPLIIGHIITGLLVGPAVLDLVHSTETVELFSHMGIALLLFIIGLGLNPRVISEVGKVAVLTGIGQIVFTTAIGFVIAVSLGFPPSTAVYIAIALAFSSTIIILKLLSDRKDTHRLYGKIATGFLLVQDIVAVMVLVAITAIGQDKAVSAIITETLLIGIIFIAAIAVISVYILPRLTKFLGSTQEFLFLFAIGWGFGVAAIAHWIGFSIEIGALAAGVALAGSPFAFEVASKLRPLRDFFIVLFFVVLGAELELAAIGAGLLPAVAFAIFILIGNPIIVMIIMGLLNFSRKIAFKAGLTVAQISEFSLILLLLARDVGQIGDDIVAMVTLVAMITIAASTYMIIYSDKLFELLDPYLRIFERKNARDEARSGQHYDIIMFGFKAGSRSLIESFRHINKRYLVVDYDPEVDAMLKHERVSHVYGDANDTEFLAELPLDKAKLVLLTLTDFKTNCLIVEHIMQLSAEVVIIAKAEEPHEAQELYDLGADYVIMPHFLSSMEVSRRLKRHGLDTREHFSRARKQHLEYLNRSNK